MAVAAGERVARLAADERLLVRAVLGSAEERERSWFELRGRFDLDHLSPGAYQLVPMLSASLNEIAPNDPAGQRLSGIAKKTWYQNQLLLGRLELALASLAREHIQATAMHALSLALLYYPQPWQRPLRRVELLVPRSRMRRAVDAFVGAGWRADGGIQIGRQRAGLPSRLVSPNGVCVLRSELLPRVGIPPASTQLECGGLNLGAVTPTDELLFLFCDTLRDDPRARLQWIVDAAMVLGAASDRVDWMRLVAAAEEGDALERVREATQVLAHCDVSPPQSFIDSLGRSPIASSRPGEPGKDASVEMGGATDQEGRGLRERVVAGLGWKIASQGSGQFSKIVLGVILARLLTPHEFGLAAEVLVFTGMARTFTDIALGAALVQRPTIDEHDRSTVFWTTCAVGAVMTVGGIAAAGTVAGFYGEPALLPLFAVGSLAFALNAISATQATLLVRAMNFRRLELTAIASGTASTATAITVAALGYGAWAIITLQLVSAAVSATLLWALSSWRPHFTFSARSLRELGGFGSKIFASRFFFYVNVNTDNLIVGRFLGAAALGTYALAYNSTLTPFGRVATPVQQVLYPALARVGDPRQLGLHWLRGTRLLSAVLVPAFLGLAAVAPDAVHVVFGSRWVATTAVIEALSWVGVVLALQSLNQTMLQARGRPGWVLRFASASSVTNVAAFLIGVRWGVVGVAVCLAVSRTIGLPLYTALCCRAAQVSLREYAHTVKGVLESAAAMFAVLLAARLLLIEAGLGPNVRFALLVVLGLCAYALLLAARAPDVLSELRGLRVRTRPGPAQALAAPESP